MIDISIYDEVSFPSYPHPLTHPQRLATIARLRGLVTAPVDRCRVLELGCGAGGNLIPIAETLPGSEFLGVDLSQQQIEVAIEHIRAMGLKNIRFQAADFSQLDQSMESFDYILCHGVYSWTTDEGRATILELCHKRLSPSGIAYINYNTFPGWHVQGMLRDMLRFHCGPFAEPAQRVRAARKMIAFLLSELSASSTASTSLLRDELAQLSRQSDSYLFHAYLNVVNQPFYLHQLIEQAAQYRLQYVGDSEASATWPEAISSQTVERIRTLVSREEEPFEQQFDTHETFEQYFDFVRFSMSRRSLFCHEQVALQNVAREDVLESLQLSAHVRVQDQSAHASAATTVITAERLKVTVADQRLGHLLRLLQDAWPESRPWKSVFAEIQQLVNQAEISVDQTAWLMDLFRLFVRDIVHWSVQPNLAVRTISTCPRATAFASRQAASLGFVANLRHHAVNVNEVERQVLQLLDGAHSAQQIAAKTDQSLATVQQTLERLAALSLLVA